MRINEMKIKNLFLTVYDQLTREGAWRNIFVTHNAFGIFSRYSHTARGSGKPKMSYPTKTVALKAAKAMGEKHGVHFSVYKCAWCDGWHVGKNAQNKVVHENKSETDNLSFVNKPNALYEALKRYPDQSPGLLRLRLRSFLPDGLWSADGYECFSWHIPLLLPDSY